IFNMNCIRIIAIYISSYVGLSNIDSDPANINNNGDNGSFVASVGVGLIVVCLALPVSGVHKFPSSLFWKVQWHWATGHLPVP
ncbi:34167_t:CDS:2, partial [Racocetra persica]